MFFRSLINDFSWIIVAKRYIESDNFSGSNCLEFFVGLSLGMLRDYATAVKIYFGYCIVSIIYYLWDENIEFVFMFTYFVHTKKTESVTE